MAGRSRYINHEVDHSDFEAAPGYMIDKDTTATDLMATAAVAMAQAGPESHPDANSATNPKNSGETSKPPESPDEEIALIGQWLGLPSVAFTLDIQDYEPRTRFVCLRDIVGVIDYDDDNGNSAVKSLSRTLMLSPIRIPKFKIPLARIAAEDRQKMPLVAYDFNSAFQLLNQFAKSKRLNWSLIRHHLAEGDLDSSPTDEALLGNRQPAEFVTEMSQVITLVIPTYVAAQVEGGVRSRKKKETTAKRTNITFPLVPPKNLGLEWSRSGWLAPLERLEGQVSKGFFGKIEAGDLLTEVGLFVDTLEKTFTFSISVKESRQRFPIERTYFITFNTGENPARWSLEIRNETTGQTQKKRLNPRGDDKDLILLWSKIGDKIKELVQHPPLPPEVASDETTATNLEDYQWPKIIQY